jgi:ABC-type bacteriocin/lantibiotic exporter with double-glycine peptidase domain
VILSSIVRRHLALLVLVMLGLPILLIVEYFSLSLLFRLTEHNLTAVEWLEFARIHSGLAGSDAQNLAIFAVLLLFAIRVVLGFSHTALTLRLGRLFQRDINFAVYSNIVCTSGLSEVAQNGAGHFVNLAGEGASKASQVFITSVRMIEGWLTVIAAFVVLLRTSSSFALAFLIFGAISAAFVYAAFKAVYRLGTREFNHSAASAAVFVESINNVRAIRALLSEPYFLGKYRLLLGSVIEIRIHIEVLRAAQRAFPAMLLLVASSVVLNPWHPLVPSLDPVMIVGLIVVTLRLMAALGGIVTAVGGIYADWPAIRVLAKLEIGEQTASGLWQHAGREQVGVALEIESLTFRHPGAVRDLFTGLSFRFESGRSYALMGPSGAGKSTFVDLLAGNVCPTEGCMRLDGRVLSSGDMRSLVLVVEQSPKIFSMSIRENLTLGCNYTDSQLREALVATRLGSFIDTLDAGLDTVLDYQAGNVSGGQLQRLALARALLQNPTVLVLDESTTGLDIEVKQAVIANVKGWMANGILLFVTHDAEVAAQTDVCIRLQAGALVS